MLVGNLMARAIDQNGAVYLPYVFENEWTISEKTIIGAAIDPHVPYRVDSMFNGWKFTKNADNLFVAKRATWSYPIIASSVDDLINRLVQYHKE